MNSVPVPYTPPATEEKTFDVKKALTITLITGLSIGAIAFFGSKAVKKKKTDKSDAQSFTVGTPEYKAKQIKMFFENDSLLDAGTDVTKLRQLLTQVGSKQEMDKIRAEYKSQNNSILDNDLKKELRSNQFIELSQIIHAKPEKPGAKVNPAIQAKAWAIRLKAAFDEEVGPFSATDEDAVKRVFFEIPTHQKFIDTGVAYHREYGRNLMTDLKDELSSSEWMEVMTMLTKKPKK